MDPCEMPTYNFISCKCCQNFLQLVHVVASFSGWRTVTWKCCIIPSLTNTSCTCTTAVCCRWSSHTAASGLLAPARTTCWTPGARRTVLAYFRCGLLESLPVLWLYTWISRPTVVARHHCCFACSLPPSQCSNSQLFLATWRITYLKCPHSACQ